MTTEEIKEQLWKELDLDNRSIIFNLFDIGDGTYYVGGSIIGCADDLYEESRFFDIGYDSWYEAGFDVALAETYMIGNGESEHADSGECAFIENLLNRNKKAFMTYLESEADCINAIDDVYVDNPCYEEEDEEDPFDDEDD